MSQVATDEDTVRMLSIITSKVNSDGKSYDNVEPIFNNGDKYVIPRYQRAYAWEKPQINQLLDDIYNIDLSDENHRRELSDDSNDRGESRKYHLGSLVVIKDKSDRFEVIDGQQRLTTLYLLIALLRLQETDSFASERPLSFELRAKSDSTLRDIQNIMKNIENSQEGDDELLDRGIVNACKLIRDWIGQHLGNEDGDSYEKNRDEFIEKMKRLRIYRIEMPPCTDKTRYFEIINSRGEQLVSYEILKARLMSYLLPESNERLRFARIWDACSNMNDYVQMHFNPIIRKELFSDTWDTFESPCAESANQLDWGPEGYNRDSDSNLSTLPITFDEALDAVINESSPKKAEANKTDLRDDDEHVRFTSIMGFPVFLLATLAVFCKKYEVISRKDVLDARPDQIANWDDFADDKPMSLSLDDHRLLERFNDVMDHGCICFCNVPSWAHNYAVGCETVSGVKILPFSENGEKSLNRRVFSNMFIECLLKCRWLFDKYIVKRKRSTNEESGGVWSIEKVSRSPDKEGNTSNGSHYVNTEFPCNSSRGIEDGNKAMVMLQSCLRVSYTSQTSMRWVTDLLSWIYDNVEGLKKLEEKSQEIARSAIIEYIENNPDWMMDGTGIRHIVFNYLDYLLWKDERVKLSNKDAFTFIESRSAVEHWYPQNPSNGKPKWADVDNFGNLCLIQPGLNSHLSNYLPEGKKEEILDEISNRRVNCSLKLQLMIEKTQSNKGWLDGDCAEHGQNMIKKLYEDLVLSDQLRDSDLKAMVRSALEKGTPQS